MLVFVDTNILAYARDLGDPGKQRIAQAWLESLGRHRAGRLSWQVLGEYYSVATRKLAANAEAARADIRALETWRPLAPDVELYNLAWGVCDRHGYSWWDALIIAAALRSHCEVLLTEDLQYGQVIDDVLRIVDPFLPEADAPPA